MKKFLISCLFILCLCGSAFGQNEWSEFPVTNGGFVIKFPGTPQESTSNNGANKTHTYSLTVKGKGNYTVTYFDTSIDESHLPLKKEYVDKIISITQENLIQLEDTNSGPRGSLINAFPVSIAGYPGKGVLFKSAKGSVYNTRIYLVNKRVYVLLCTGTTEEDRKKFFDSFALK